MIPDLAPLADFGSLALMLAVWVELRHLARLSKDHEARLRALEARRT